jgi:hypothetical protein
LESVAPPGIRSVPFSMRKSWFELEKNTAILNPRQNTFEQFA